MSGMGALGPSSQALTPDALPFSQPSEPHCCGHFDRLKRGACSPRNSLLPYEQAHCVKTSFCVKAFIVGMYRKT